MHTLEGMSGFHIENFGCRAARADGEAVGARLLASGLIAAGANGRDDADVILVNTCSVTAEADRVARAFIRRTHRRNPGAKIVVTGCYAQRAPEELAGMAGVAAVVGNSHKALTPEIILALAAGKSPSQPAERTNENLASASFVSVGSLVLSGTGAPVWVDDRFAHSFLEEAQVLPGVQTRPNLKIQEGCGNRCTFCVIPQTRGSSRSLPRAVVMRQVEGFVASGGKELVLSGINLGRWGRDLNPSEDSCSPTHSAQSREMDGASLSSRPTLAGIVREILERTKLPRLRLSSIEPMDWDAQLIGVMAEFGGTRLARHAHLPLQSGSDAVLRRMHRRYRPWHYAEKVAALVAAAGPELTLGADVMVGFPGETDAEFEETVGMVRALPFGYLHLFPFSPRPGTQGRALHAEQPVPAAVMVQRMAALRALAAEKSAAHRRQFVGREVDAITMHTPDALRRRGRTAALTENFLPVEIVGALEANTLVRLRVAELTGEGALKGLPMNETRNQYEATATSV